MLKAIVCFLLFLATATSATASTTIAAQNRLTGPQLFPDKTVAYFRIDNVADCRNKLSQTATGKLLEDPDLKRFFGTFYEQILALGQSIQNELGLSLEELLSLPAGEFALGVIPTPKEPEIYLLLDVGAELPALEILLARLEAKLIEDGLRKEIKKVGEIQTTLYREDQEANRFGYFIDNGVLVANFNSNKINYLAEVWTGSNTKHVSLASNTTFATLLSRCVGTQGERPQISFYADPVGIFRESIRNSPNALVTLAAIKTLGLDGFKAVGGSVILATNEFDSVLHLHATMDQPRPGVLSLLKPKSGSTEPESWVGEDVVSYATANWDVKATINAIRKIVDTFSGDGTFDNTFLNRISKDLNLDIKKDILDQLADRFTLSAKILPDRRLNSQSTLVGIHVKDSSFVETKVLPKIFDLAKKGDARWTTKDVFGTKVYYLNNLSRTNEFVRVPQPAVCMIKQTVVIGDSLAVVESAIEVQRAEEALLSDSIEFRMIQEKIKAQMNGREFSIMSYSRPDEQIKLFYELGSDPKNIAKLEESSQNNPVLQALVTALKSGSLPPFERIQKHIAPTGAFITEEDDGLHYTVFTLKRE